MAGQSFYTTYRWKQVRARVLKQQHNTCFVCGLGGANTVHHVKERLDYPELAYQMDNLKAVHEDCHTRLHKSDDDVVEVMGDGFSDEAWR